MPTIKIYRSGDKIIAEGIETNDKVAITPDELTWRNDPLDENMIYFNSYDPKVNRYRSTHHACTDIIRKNGDPYGVNYDEVSDELSRRLKD